MLYRDLKKDRGNIEARIFDSCHDRLLTIGSNKEIWHLGVSLNGIGGKAFMISKVIDEVESNAFIHKYTDWWKNGKEV